MADNMFIGKSAILGWLNSTLQLKLEKVEDVSSRQSIVKFNFGLLKGQIFLLSVPLTHLFSSC